MSGMSKALRGLVAGMVVAGASLLAANSALADKLYLKDGTVLEGKVTREGPGFIFFKIKVGTVESETLYQLDKVLKIERDAPAPKESPAAASDGDKKEEDKKGEAKTEKHSHTGATKVAILDFGPPSDWQGSAEGMVGREISVVAFRRALPLLKKAGAEVVVIRVNSGGGLSTEMPKFQDLFEQEYKPNFRTVAWIESAISAAAMSPWVIEEYYFFPQGNMGACTEFNMASMKATTGFGLEEVLLRMEKASAWGKKDPCIMRAMQIEEPLSLDVDENGEVHWRQDLSGQVIMNPKGQVFTINAKDAVKYKFAKAIAANKEDLVKAMGLREVEWVGKDATALVDQSLKDNDAAYKNFEVLEQKYMLAIGTAEAAPDKERRGMELSIARRLLAELKQKVSLNPNFPNFIGLGPGWFEQQNELIKKLGAMP